MNSQQLWIPEEKLTGLNHITSCGMGLRAGPPFPKVEDGVIFVSAEVTSQMSMGK